MRADAGEVFEIGTCSGAGMQFELTARIGFGWNSRVLPPIEIAQHDIDHIAEFAGAYHVLEMGQHYRDYVERGDTPQFPPILGFPVSAYFEPLTNKQRAQGVTGNIGEAVAGIVAHRVLEVPPSGVAHIRLQRPFRRRQCPDFMIRTGPKIPTVLASLPLPSTIDFPAWWPLESKARVDGNACNQAVSDAFRQLAAYWYTIARGARAEDVGFGFVVTCAYDRNAGICLRVFVPTNVAALQRYLTSFRSYDELVDEVEADNGTLRSLVHG